MFLNKNFSKIRHQAGSQKVIFMLQPWPKTKNQLK